MTAFIVMTLLAVQPAGAPVTVAQGADSGISEVRTVLVRSTADWEALWKAHAGAEAGRPAVDFTKSLVAAVFSGVQPTAGFSVQITGTRRDGSTLVVEYVVRRPGPGLISAQVLTSPFHIVTLPQDASPVRFENVSGRGR